MIPNEAAANRPNEPLVALVVSAYVRALADQLRAALGPRLIGLILFGSCARGDHRPGSDVDLLLVVDTADRSADRAVRAAIEAMRHHPTRLAVMEAGLAGTPELVTISAQRLAEHPWLLLDVAADGVAFCDDGALLAENLAQVRASMQRYGTRRVTQADGGWYWELKPGMAFGEVVTL